MYADEDQREEWSQRRRAMVDQQIRRRGLTDPRVLEVMASLPREEFVPADQKAAALEDRPVPIGWDQTISQPYIVAFMTTQLSLAPNSRILEIGTGTGYQTAILARLAGHVYSVERIAALGDLAAQNLQRLGIANATLVVRDGSLGCPEHAPFDRILVTAAAPKVPAPLIEQLAEDGVMVMPIGGRSEQTLVKIVRTGSRTIETPLLACRFVKLVGRSAWPENSGRGR